MISCIKWCDLFFTGIWIHFVSMRQNTKYTEKGFLYMIIQSKLKHHSELVTMS